jgi:hypothetical protein
MKIRAADRAGRHLDDGVAPLLDSRIWNALASNVVFAVPGQCFHVLVRLSIPNAKRTRRLAAFRVLENVARDDFFVTGFET